jgi:hypothetical protein
MCGAFCIQQDRDKTLNFGVNCIKQKVDQNITVFAQISLLKLEIETSNCAKIDEIKDCFEEVFTVPC